MAKKSKEENSFIKKYGLFLVIIIFLVIFLVVMLVTGGYKKSNTNKSSSGEPKTMNVSDWITKTKGNDVMVTVFAQTTCSWCKKFKPVVKEVIGEEKADIYWFDVDTVTQDEYSSLGEAYSDLKDFGTPYTLITQNGKKIDEISGYVEKSTLIAKLKTVGVLK